ncbi:unnamed protein product [Arctia plantaginis]|uniref:Uncharacterized protein n=1 Tax=Arctia plantaginis TaxID=874455 RepID=A0A8S1BHM7_ARCPL|nr:unnamed protein product [Arctia plantaginis]
MLCFQVLTRYFPGVASPLYHRRGEDNIPRHAVTAGRRIVNRGSLQITRESYSGCHGGCMVYVLVTSHEPCLCSLSTSSHW